MNIKKIIISMLFITSAAFSINSQTAAKVKPLVLENQTSPDSFVKLDTSVYGASVYIDGSYAGTTPLHSKKISKGRHSLRITKNHYAPKELTFYVKEGETKSFILDLENISAWLNISCPVNGADIYLDGSHISEGRIETDEGSHTISASKFGYEKYTQNFYISRRETKSFNVELKEAEFNIKSISASKKTFNPENKGFLGKLDINFSVTAPENGSLVIKDSEGKVFAEKQFSFTTWDYEYSWDGSDDEGYIIYDGTYTAVLYAGGKSASCTFKVDSSISYPALTMTNDGSGLGSSALPLPFPDLTILAGFSSGAYFYGPVTEQNKAFYAVPLDIFLSAGGEHVELGLNFQSFIKKANSFGFGITLKLQDKIAVSADTSFNYGASFRLASSNIPVFEPFGADCGNGIGMGAMAGFDFNGLYIGANSTFIFKHLSITDSEGQQDEKLWKNGITIVKNCRTYTAGIYGTVQSTFGSCEFEYRDSDKNTAVFSENIRDSRKAFDTGFAFNTYLGASSTLLNFNGGMILYPGTESYVYAKVGFTFMIN